jgi:hypothetical protein
VGWSAVDFGRLDLVFSLSFIDIAEIVQNVFWYCDHDQQFREEAVHVAENVTFFKGQDDFPSAPPNMHMLCSEQKTKAEKNTLKIIELSISVMQEAIGHCSRGRH